MADSRFDALVISRAHSGMVYRRWKRIAASTGPIAIDVVPFTSADYLY